MVYFMLNRLLEDSETIPQTFKYKFDNNLLTIEDQQEALTDPRWAYCFASANIPGSDIKALQAKACEEPYYAFLFAKYIPGADIKYCQEHACKDAYWAHMFALYVPGADKEYCRQVCKGTRWEF